MKRAAIPIILLTLLIASAALPTAARQDSSCPLEPLIMPGQHGVALAEITTHAEPDATSQSYGTVAAGEQFQVDPQSEARCIDGTRWLQVSSMSAYGWVPESADGEYLVEPYIFTPEAPVPFDVPLNDPVITRFDHPLPTVAPAANPQTIDVPFAEWDWDAFMQDYWVQAPDPLALQLPAQYAGDLPSLPVSLSDVHFVQDAALNDQQLALLAQNGFVVVPGTDPQFDDVYRDRDGAWDHETGKAPFVTTDALLHSLFLIYQNALMFLESEEFYGEVGNFLMQGYQAAEAQHQQALGTHLEAPTRSAAVYYAVALMLLADGQDSYVLGYQQIPVYPSWLPSPASVLAEADPSILAEAEPLADLARAATGREPVSILEDYEEDFSQYLPRSYYAGNPLLEAYFRTMMWLGRITFKAESQADTLTGLMVLRALHLAPDAYASWENVADTLEFLVGPIDDYSPRDYLPIALAPYAFREDFSLGAFNDPDTLFYFQFHAAQLPPPRVNSIPIEIGALMPEELVEQTRGFRLFGQRFTFDAYLMQELIYPAVGTASNSRTLPLGLDVPAVLGSDMAYALTEAAGAAEFENYTDQVSQLRSEVNDLTANDWLQNLYGGWLWALQPLALRDSALIPPMMQTDAWRRKDLTTFLGSYTELKHATLLYAEQPVGGLGGGGMIPPVISNGYVEPQPLVFSRIAILSALLYDGLDQRGLLFSEEAHTSGAMNSIGSTLHSLAALSAQLAEMARKEVAGEPLSHDELYYLQENIGNTLWFIRYEVEIWLTDPPEDTSIVADVASNPAAGTALEIAIGTPDLIYVVTNSPYGLQVTRGAVYSYYEFTQPIDERLTDDDWREILAVSPPPRQDWIDLYFSP